MIAFIAIFVVFIYLLIYFFKLNQYDRRLPPGPSRLCVHSQTVLFKDGKHLALTELGKTYGHIYHIYFATKLVIVLNSYEAIKEAFVTKGDCFIERPHVFIFDWFENNEGIAFSHGKIWKEQRQFAIQTLSEFGFGKSSLEEHIMIEVQHVIQEIEGYQGKKFELHYLLDKAIANIICSLAFNRRYDYEDIQLEKKIEWLEVIFDNFGLLNPINFFPAYRHVSKKFKEFDKAVKSIRTFIRSIVDEHEATYQADSHRDYIDEFIRRMKEDQAQGITDTTFIKGNLVKVVENLFAGGTFVVGASLMWCIKFLMLNPDKEKKVIEELDNNIGVSRPISLSDRPNMPYTEAVILETHRFASIFPLALFHSTTQDVQIFDYTIPKDTIIIPNLYAVHNDPKNFPNPREFRPERFLDLNGKVKRNLKNLIPYSIGKRDCLGQPLAKMELTLFISNLLHRFEFVVPPNDSTPNINNFNEGLIFRPNPFNVIAKLR